MRKLIPKAAWLKKTVTEEEARGFNSALGTCCGPRPLRLNLEGTPCDRWNKSAAEVFIDDFLRTHLDYSPEEEVVAQMVEMKTRAAIESIIREYRKSKKVMNQAEREEAQADKNRHERRRKASSVIHTFTACNGSDEFP